MMKKLFPVFCFALAIMFAACNNDDDNEKYIVLDFENVPEQSLAGPTSKGENLYDEYDGEQYISYHDRRTDLKMGITERPSGIYNFWSGGIAISRWNITEGAAANDWTNQCSVYFKAQNGYGGKDGSKTFGVVNCSEFGEQRPSLRFATATTERVFESIWVTNSTYTALSIKDGNSFTNSKPLKETEGWFKLTVAGFSAAGKPTGTIDFYLADFREGGKGLVLQWSEINLSTLGKVNRIEFSLSGSDTGKDGLNTPAYFCIDDVKIRL